MGPKAKGKTKEEVDAERAALEEQAAQTEAERARLAAFEERRHQEAQAERARLAAENIEIEKGRVGAERVQLAPRRAQANTVIKAFDRQCAENAAWQRHLSCTVLPSILDQPAMTDFMNAQLNRCFKSVNEALDCADDNLTLLSFLCAKMQDPTTCKIDAKQLYSDYQQLHRLIIQHIDNVTLWFLLHSSEFADAEGNIRHAVLHKRLKWAAWSNVHKNPRLKVLNFPEVGIQLGIPKQIALAPIAMRAYTSDTADKYWTEVCNTWMAIGPVISVDLLAMPPDTKSINEWCIRLQSSMTKTLHKLPYPMNCGDDESSSSRWNEEKQQIRISNACHPSVALQEKLQVGVWDKDNRCWSVEQISGVQYSEHTLAFNSTTLGHFAVICDRAAMFPYRSWYVIPNGCINGEKATLAVHLALANASVILEVGSGTICLKEPNLPATTHMLNKPMLPVELLLSLRRTGINLMPEARDATFVGMELKDSEVEQAMCEDVSLLAGSHLIASSCWTRVVKVRDWELGGLTTLSDASRIFEKEMEHGPASVAVLIRRGQSGVAFSKAFNYCKTYPELPTYDDPRSNQCIWGEVHESVIPLLTGEFACALIDEEVTAVAQRDELEMKRRQADAKRWIEVEELLKKGQKPAPEMLEDIHIDQKSMPCYWPTNWASAAESLKSSSAATDRMNAFNPIVSRTLAQTMFLLRLFSISVT